MSPALRLVPVAALLAAAPRSVAATPQDQIVAVFDVESSGAPLSAEALDRLGDYLMTKIAAVRGYQVVPRAALQQRLRAQKRDSYKSCYDQSCQIEIGRELAAQKSLSTKILRLGQQCVVTMALYDLQRATTERAADATTECSIGALVRAIEEAALKLVGPRGDGVPAAQGVVDRKHCPAPGARRLGEPYPDGSAIWCVDARGQRDGPSIQWHANGRISATSHYRQGRLEGPLATFYPSGKKLSLVGYRGNRMHGRWQRFDEAGSVSEEGAYEDGKRVGLWTQFDREGRKRTQETYRGDDKHGPAAEWFENGQRRASYANRNGVKEGRYTRWDDEGRLREEGSFVADKREGRWVVYFGDGGREEQTWRAGKQHGPSSRWRDGHKVEEGPYANGQRSGHWIRYTVSRGALIKSREGDYLQDKLHGRWTSYDASGGKRQVDTYRAGKREGPSVTFGSDGQPVVEGEYRDDKMHGTWRYFQRGALSRQVRYREGQRVDD